MKNEQTKSDEPKKTSTLGDRMNSGLLRPENGEYDLSKAVIPDGLVKNEEGMWIKKTQEELLDEKYGKGYSFGKKMQSGIPMPEEPYDVGEFLVNKYPDLFYTDEKGHVKRRD